MSSSMSQDSRVESSAFRRLRSDVAAGVERARSLQERAASQFLVFLKTELAIGITQARIALRSGNPKQLSRATAIARQSYHTIIRLSQRLARRSIQSEQFTAELDWLRDALRKLGEKV
jgi:hypothetical protein